VDNAIWNVGIDEAGYAPRLGPLVVTAVSLRAAPGDRDLFASLGSCVRRVGRRPAGACRRLLAVGDSKKIYSPAKGIAQLERSVLAFARVALGELPPTDLDLARALTGNSVRTDGLIWYAGAPEELPLAAGRADVDDCARRLGEAFAGAGLCDLGIASRVITARELNAGVNDEVNKADFLCSVVAGLLSAACTGREEATVTVDRLGGRKDYAELVGRAWPGWRVEPVSVGSEVSRYRARLPEGGSPGRAPRREIAFRCRAEDASLTVALASMVSKYLRELFMRRLNRYFSTKIDGIEPTAGYPVDAARFLRETEGFRRAAGLRDDVLIRSR
jgi:hypothetical protein